MDENRTNKKIMASFCLDNRPVIRNNISLFEQISAARFYIVIRYSLFAIRIIDVLPSF